MNERLNLSSKIRNYNSIFGDENNETPDTDIKMLPIGLLKPFPNHPFKLYTGEKLDKLVDSIKDLGILNPILVRKENEEYQTLAGHNRTNAAEICGMKNVPCIIKDVDFDTASQIVVDSNLRQRESLLPSERAFAYKMKLEAMNRQGKRSNDSELIKKSREIVGEELGDSGSQVQRYIRLTFLIVQFLELVDENKIPVNTAVELSYLSTEEQEILYQLLSEDSLKIKLSQATELKNLSKLNCLTASDILSTLKNVSNMDKKAYLKLPKNNFKKYFKENDSEEQVLITIIKALDVYFNNL